MKYLIAIFFSLFLYFSMPGQNIGIGTTTPDASAMLDVVATNRGMLIPRLTTTQRTGISPAANGLLVFDADTKSFWFYNGLSAMWVEILSGSVKTIADADGDTKIQVEESANEDIIRFDLGGAEKMILRKNASGQERLEMGLNTAVGKDALSANVGGTDNSAFGNGALFTNTAGAKNTALGAFALNKNTTGNENTAIGYYALNKNTTGTFNTAVGDSALYTNTTGSQNTAVGNWALQYNTTGWDNTSVGLNSMVSNTSGNYNAAFGSWSLISNTIGSWNSAFGNNALYSNTSGNQNTATGNRALNKNSTGTDNTASGMNAMFNNTTGNYNTGLGSLCLWSNSTASYNTAVGNNAMYSMTVGTQNTSVGGGSLRSTTNGNNNTSVGFEAAVNGNHAQSTFIGSNINISTNITNVSALGYGIQNAQCTNHNQILLGNTAIGQIRAQVSSITAYSDARFKTNVSEDVKGLDFITRLKPVTYNENPEVLHQIWGTPDSVLSKIDHTGIKSQRFIGFLAQDVEQAAKDSGFEFPGVDVPQNDKEVYALRYVDFIMPMVKSIQEQQALILQLQIENRELKLNAAKFEKEIELIKSYMAKSN
ncbi:MAG: tail fiber domain-containing protein [Saprospiraceae bacterium]|nr:tail fiber domain-containing protein [Saprospiraceae bacterium]